MILQQQVDILYIGSDNPADTKEMLFYLQRAFATTREIKPNVISHPGNAPIPSNDIETAHLIIVADTISRENLVSLRQYLKSDRTLLLVIKSTDDVDTLMGLSTVENIESAH